MVTQAPLIQEERPAQKSLLRDLVEIILLALAIYIIIIFLVQTVHVMGKSMVPTLQDQDYLIASKISYHLHEPQRGDIVVFKPTTDATHDYIKRIIAVPGDRLRISHAQIFINGRLLKEPYLNGKWVWDDTWSDGQQVVVPPDSYFVMGDNRNFSSDSRAFGYQPKERFLGKAWLRVWPLNAFKVFSNNVSYAS